MNLSKTDLILIGIMSGLLFYLYALPTIKEKMSNFTQPAPVRFDKKACSRDCCKYTQWPVPHMNNNDSKHIGTNLMCNHGNGGGCVCVTNKEYNYLSSRGDNGLDSF